MPASLLMIKILVTMLNKIKITLQRYHGSLLAEPGLYIVSKLEHSQLPLAFHRSQGLVCNVCPSLHTQPLTVGSFLLCPSDHYQIHAAGNQVLKAEVGTRKGHG